MAQDEVRAMWVWNTRELLFDEPGKTELFEFCKAKGVTEIFAQVVMRFEGGGDALKVRFLYLHELKVFLKRASEAGDQNKYFTICVYGQVGRLV